MSNYVHLIFVHGGEKQMGQGIGEAYKRFSRMRNWEKGSNFEDQEIKEEDYDSE